MYRQFFLCLCLLLFLTGTAVAGNKDSAGKAAPAAKQLSGISIVGNDDAPKSLFIVPWKPSELGSGTSLNRMLTESAVPVDMGEFMRQLEIYEVGNKK